jgi:hypothetical protein
VHGKVTLIQVSRRVPAVELAPAVEMVSVRRASQWDRLLLGLALSALALAILKPWPSGLGGPAVATVDPALAAELSGAAESRVVLPPQALDPPAGRCFDEMGWQVCLLGSAAGQAIRSSFDPDAPPAAAHVGDHVPVALVVTADGAGLGFYAPVAGLKRMSPGAAVTLWRTDDPVAGVTYVSLRPARAAGFDGLTTSLSVTSSADLPAALRWPDGRYAILLQAVDGSARQEYFALEVVTALPTPGLPTRFLRPGKVAV